MTRQQITSHQPIPEDDETLVDPAGRARRESADIWKPGTILPENYIVRECLGRGGSGRVYRVERPVSHGILEFAVKRLIETRFNNPDTQKEFYRELRTWIDLPLHANLTACRFFRVIEGHLVIFSEYVNGGSLTNRIRAGKLRSNADRLDIAIQCAWGLHVAHLHGVIHQDVKPGNILLTTDGLAKVTDFGLARTLPRLSPTVSPHLSPSNHVSSHGMTPAYCSPEQADGCRLDHRTDIWSLGVSILEMFLGHVTWQIGVLAPDVLSMMTPPTVRRSIIPKPIASILSKCFMSDPSERWESMDALADSLIAAWGEMIGDPYPRTRPDYPLPSLKDCPTHDRSTDLKASWRDPVHWVKEACRAVACPIPEPVDSDSESDGSRSARTLADLEMLDLAERIFSRADLNSTRIVQAQMLQDRALLLTNTGDLSGAISALDRALTILNDRFCESNSCTISDFLGRIFNNRGMLRIRMGRIEEAMQDFDRSLEICRNIANPVSPEQHNLWSAKLHTNRGMGFAARREFLLAIEDYDRGISVITDSMSETDDLTTRLALAQLYTNKAGALYALERYDEAVLQSSRSVAIWDRVLAQYPSGLYLVQASGDFMNHASALMAIRKPDDALVLYDRTIDILEHAVYREGRRELRMNLTRVLTNKALTLEKQNRLEEALALHSQVIDIRTFIVFQEGAVHLLPTLARAIINKAVILSEIGQTDTARKLSTDALEMLESEIMRGGSETLSKELAYLRTIVRDYVKTEP